MSEFSVKFQTYLVIGVMLGCFSILYPKVFHPIVLNMFGWTTHKRTMEDEPMHMRFHPEARRGAKQSEKMVLPDRDRTKEPGIMKLLLPVYAIGIVVYLVYTLSKIFSSKRRNKKAKKENFLKQYYQDFHYDVNQGKFRMSHDASGDDDEEGDESDLDNSHLFGTKHQGSNGKTSKRFDWGKVHPDIYRSAKSLPHDLERLLLKMDSEDLDYDELSRLRMRLEQTEQEMTRILDSVQIAEQQLSDKLNGQNQDCHDDDDDDVVTKVNDLQIDQNMDEDLNQNLESSAAQSMYEDDNEFADPMLMHDFAFTNFQSDEDSEFTKDCVRRRLNVS